MTPLGRLGSWGGPGCPVAWSVWKHAEGIIWWLTGTEPERGGLPGLQWGCAQRSAGGSGKGLQGGAGGWVSRCLGRSEGG